MSIVTSSVTSSDVETSPVTALIEPLQSLDALLAAAFVLRQQEEDEQAEGYGGLCIGANEVARLLIRMPCAPASGSNVSVGALVQQLYAVLQGCMPLARLQRRFGLTNFETATLLIALAPELDARYERIYGYLQDDATRKRPCVDLALELLCATASDCLTRRADFDADAPLLRHGLLTLTAEPHQADATSLRRSLLVRAPVVRALLGHSGLDAVIADCCRLVAPARSTVETPPGLSLDMSALACCLRDDVGAPRVEQARGLYLQGLPDAGSADIVAALAAELSLPTLWVDLVHAPFAGEGWSDFIRTLLLEATLRETLLAFARWDALAGHEQTVARERLLRALAAHRDLRVVVTGTADWPANASHAADLLVVAVPAPDFSARREQWQRELDATGATLPSEDLDALADRFRLYPGQIARAARAAQQQAWLRSGLQPAPSASTSLSAHLFRAARAQTNRDLGTLATRIEPRHTHDALVLPEDSRAQLHSLCDWVRHRNRVLGQWGFADKLPYGRGVSALFFGPSGTGKTMAAAIIAGELGLDLYKIDLSGVVSKYIGETEKNLSALFEAATQANAILFFDEADALFGKRSEVKDAHDRHANIEVAYLLQKMEQYEGVTILASNLRQDMDEAFTRRLAFIIPFPFPDESHRRRIWEGIWPAETPLEAGIDWDLLAREFRLSGGNIKNIALGAAFLAAAQGCPVGMTHLMQATRREYHKLGKTPPEATCSRT